MMSRHQTETAGEAANGPPTAAQLLEAATERHRAGDLAHARRLYREVLHECPANATALLRSGLLELQDARPDAALALIERAAALEPHEPRHQSGLGTALQALGRHADAAAAYRRALGKAPSAELHFALGLALQSQGLHVEAIAAYANAVEAQPGYFAALNNLGICRQRCGRFADAAAAYTQALEVRPNQAGAMANLGTVLQEIGRLDEAIQMLRAAANLEPKVPAHRVNLGIALCRRRDFAAAQDALRGALDLDPRNAEALFNLGNALQGLDCPREAEERYRAALALRPGFAEAWVNLGNVRKKTGDGPTAAACYEAALRAQPDSLAAMNNLACLWRTQGRLEDAEDLLRRGLAQDPCHAALNDTLGSVLKDAGDLDAAIACFRRSLELDPANPVTHGNLAYALNFQSQTPEPMLEEAARWNRRFGAALRAAALPHSNDPSPHRRLRVGYVSADFRDHCQSLFTVPLLSRHDHARFEIHGYASVDRPDQHTRRIAALTDAWHDVRHLDDEALAARIRDDGIDILVDLTMHMARGRPLTFARKPAPVQVAWLAYPGTTGLDAIDYRISDPRLDPADADSSYSERTIRLPDSFWCYDPLTESPAVNALPALERGFITFGCLNNPCKLTDDTLALWTRVLEAIADARLMLLAPSGRHGRKLSQRLAAHGIPAERVDFVPYRARAAYLSTYHHIDIGLDTLPYNGHTTSLDALWMGVPTITRVGGTCVGRGTLSQLFQLDLARLAAHCDDTFVAAAVELGRDLPGLARLRHELRGRLAQSALMDAGRFARNMESAYARMWSDYCARSADLRGACS